MDMIEGGSIERGRLDDLAVGERVPDLVKDPITRTQLALFAGASGDHNPIHLDDDEARRGGLPGVIAHGMLTMAFLADFVTRLAEQSRLRSLEGRFVAMAVPGDVITCTGVIAAREQAKGETIVQLDIAAVNQKGETIITGAARIAVG